MVSRTRNMNIRLTEEERARWLAAAEADGRTLTGLVKRAVEAHIVAADPLDSTRRLEADRERIHAIAADALEQILLGREEGGSFCRTCGRRFPEGAEHRCGGVRLLGAQPLPPVGGLSPAGAGGQATRRAELITDSIPPGTLSPASLTPAMLEKVTEAFARDTERDAARYRWLRDGNAYFPEEAHINGGPALDAAIDTAIVESFLPGGCEDCAYTEEEGPIADEEWDALLARHGPAERAQAQLAARAEDAPHRRFDWSGVEVDGGLTILPAEEGDDVEAGGGGDRASS